ncbi:hypothetical protein HUN03_00229 [Mycoplasmopsis anatis]|uniref:MSC_0621 family F1-like ATPase epsilon subunit n=1 Tax=Mycoplasmopsis anatis TaxID=171279 RepID=UPI001C4E05FE|nr:hypothetical protein [Mycoplasmopsis anatis]MBW0594865.1 hypothetical protein [Mycoplasmopsis anatis]MBW0595550.1 hypothetical protein [Mycoplasmopsis anatis]MBW0598457.1 hypothetical protein [Mycoplasmopsis anatis]MBW0599244.1 hypothetical protein [Mycoplasmopsis anatis]MBW0599623.1 hypothetical protein [Mycoplasmopsis anatis]
MEKKIIFISQNGNETSFDITEVHSCTQLDNNWIKISSPSVASFKKTFLRIKTTEEQYYYFILNNVFIENINETISVHYYGKFSQYVYDKYIEKDLMISYRDKINELNSKIKYFESLKQLNIASNTFEKIKEFKDELYLYKALFDFSIKLVYEKEYDEK